MIFGTLVYDGREIVLYIHTYMDGIGVGGVFALVSTVGMKPPILLGGFLDSAMS